VTDIEAVTPNAAVYEAKKCKRLLMGKNPNTFQKRQREMEKKRKAEDKRKRKQAAKNSADFRNVPSDEGTEVKNDPGA
jgi:hypothetical protein